MTDSRPANLRPHRAFGWGRGLRRLLTVVVGSLLLAFAFGIGSARAESGTPAGWQTSRATEQVRIGRMTIAWEPAVEDEAEMLMERAPHWWSEIEHNLAGDVDDGVTITFLDHAGRVADATGMPRWVAGVAHPPSGEILIARHGPDGAPSDLEELLKHEMAHVILHRAVGGADIPRWMHEGVAESFTGTISLARAQALAVAVFGPGVGDLEAIEKQFRSTDPKQASTAYAAARDFVSFLRSYDDNGMKLRQVLTEMESGKSVEAAFVRAYGKALPELVAEWRAGLPGRFMWYPLIAGGGLPFALVIPLVALAWYRRRRVLREGWERLEAQDAAERAARAGAVA